MNYGGNRSFVIRLKGTNKFIAGGNTGFGWLVEGPPPHLCEGFALAISTDFGDASDLIRELCASNADVKPNQFELVQVNSVVSLKYVITPTDAQWFRKVIKNVTRDIRRLRTLK